ncbi:hypothetical protein G9C85_01425 [Halorubellus sp. JP-L1]|uniref:hypothetical protein n=1 Tax=Halorubellus sp. JP-L1 TaxID=2715753 RepID=UPI00140743D2|nr:hypothetical protein [Halorubellus sp. JP-L1]NHN40296.1 hypothetical protein [Halorubellus sp. JP-L1]
MKRRPLLATGASTLVAVVGLAGCLDDTGSDPGTDDGTDGPTGTLPDDTEQPPGTGTASGTTDGEPTDGGTTDGETTGDATTDGWGMNEPEPDHEVIVANNYDEAVTLSVTVRRRESGEVVHESEHELDSDGSEMAYNLADANPDGVEPFEVSAESDGKTAAETIETSACYGDAAVTREYDGGLSVGYSIC